MWPNLVVLTTLCVVVLSQSPIQRGWLCGRPADQGTGHPCPDGLNPLSSGDGFVAPDLREPVEGDGKVSIPYPAGMALWHAPPGRDRDAAGTRVSIPYPAGMALWPGCPARWRELSDCLNPLSSGDGFVASTALRRRECQHGRVSIPYPAGMALWQGSNQPGRKVYVQEVSIPYPAGMALWLSARLTGVISTKLVESPVFACLHRAREPLDNLTNKRTKWPGAAARMALGRHAHFLRCRRCGICP